MGLTEIPFDFYPLPITVEEISPVDLVSSLKAGGRGRRVGWMDGQVVLDLSFISYASELCLSKTSRVECAESHSSKC